jgi:hypothetical protein
MLYMCWWLKLETAHWCPCLTDNDCWLCCVLQWVVYGPDSQTFPVVADGADYAAMIQRVGGPAAAAQWKRLEHAMKPLQKGAALFPAAAIRCATGCCSCCWQPPRSKWSLLLEPAEHLVRRDLCSTERSGWLAYPTCCVVLCWGAWLQV